MGDPVTYALVIGNVLTNRGPGRIEQKLSDGRFLSPPEGGWTDALAALCGFVPIVNTARPADTATTTYDRTVALVNSAPTVVWTARPKTQAELDAEAAAVNRTTITTQATAALDANRTFLAITSPTNAQVVALVKALTRQNNALIRLTLNDLAGTD